MADFESFGGADLQGEAMDPASFERFKQRMKAAAAQLKALQKAEQKQKKTEDDLVKILLKFIKTGTQKDILLLVSRLLELNVPAGFIVSVLLLSNPDIQKELGLKMLPEGELQQDKHTTLPDTYIQGKTLPLRVKIAIDAWSHEIDKRVSTSPHRCLKTLIDPDGLVILPAIQLASFCMRDFLEEQGIKTEYNKLKDFSNFLLQGIMKKAQEQVENQKELGDSTT